VTGMVPTNQIALLKNDKAYFSVLLLQL